MGTKRQLAETVARLITECRTGPLLDMFSGMCSVGSAVATARHVWSNDLQFFANAVAKSLFCSEAARPHYVQIAEKCLPVVKEHCRYFDNFHNDLIKSENSALDASTADALRIFFDCAIETAHKSSISGVPEYSLFVTLYSGSYFSVRQSIEIDGIRRAIDTLLNQKLISEEGHRWALISLCRSMAKCTTTTGHFAQPLSPKQGNLPRFKAQRRRSIWNEWLGTISSISAIGNRLWRRKNRVFQYEASNALPLIQKTGHKPGVVYADPPYTKDQYSRFYHIYETIILYDYPKAIGKGLYRPARAVSPFCLASEVDVAVEDLIRSCADLGADLIMSYPKNGVMLDSEHRIPYLMKQHFKSDAEVMEIPHLHSTLGASKGTQRNDVLEVIYRVRH